MAEERVSTRSVVTKGGRGSTAGAAALVAALVLVVAWSLVGSSNRNPADRNPVDRNPADRNPVDQPVAESGVRPLLLGPSPTVRWETPPKFGGRPNSQLPVDLEPSHFWARRGRYR